MAFVYFDYFFNVKVTLLMVWSHSQLSKIVFYVHVAFFSGYGFLLLSVMNAAPIL